MKSGKQIKLITFPNGEQLSSNQDRVLEICNEFHGDYDVDWVVEKDKKGKEIRRWNPNYFESIEWK